MNKITKITISIVVLMSMVFLSCEDKEITPQFENTTKPNAEFEISTEATKFKAEEVINFKDLSSDSDGFISAWNWNFGDGESLKIYNGVAPSHIYSEAGDYEISLSVADNTGSLSSVFTKSIKIKPSAASTPPQIIWNYALPSIVVQSSPAVYDDGTVLIACDLDNITRKPASPPIPNNFFAVKDGSEVWGAALFEGGGSASDRVFTSPSIASNGSIYMASFYSRNLYHLDRTTGAFLGEFYTNARLRYSAPVLAADGTIYQGGYNKGGKGFYAIDPTLSTKKWVFGAGDDFNSTPAIGSDGTIYVSSTKQDYVYAINPDGTEKWKVKYGSWSATAIAIGPDETVYFAGETSGGGGVLIAFEPSDGSIKWRNDLPAKISHGGPAIAADGTVYLGGFEKRMVAYNPEDGSEKWSFITSEVIVTVPAIDNDGNIYFGDRSGFFHILDQYGKKAFKSLQLGDDIQSSAAIGSDGIIYVAANEGDKGKIYALKTNATGLEAGGWPMFAKNAKHTGR